MNLRRALIFFNMILMLAAIWVAFTAGRIQGPEANPGSVVRNIIYAHVPGSICAMLCFVVLLVSSVMYLIRPLRMWDQLAQAGGEVGTVFAIILNVTGCIFSRAEWGIWWTPTPRLVTAAMLAFLYIAYLVLRSSIMGSADKKAKICAVFGIIAFVDVPLVFVSARYMPDIHRAAFSFDSAGQYSAFFLSMAATLLLAGLMISLRTDVLEIQEKVQQFGE